MPSRHSSYADGFVTALPRLVSPPKHLLALPPGPSSGSASPESTSTSQQQPAAAAAAAPLGLLVATQAGTLYHTSLSSTDAASGTPVGAAIGAGAEWRRLQLPQLLDVQLLHGLGSPALALVVAAGTQPAMTVKGRLEHMGACN